jgi:hypothetical protein
VNSLAQDIEGRQVYRKQRKENRLIPAVHPELDLCSSHSEKNLYQPPVLMHFSK